MTFPMQITYRHMDSSPALDERIRDLAARLATASSHVLSGHVLIAAPHQHSHQGRLFEVHLDLHVPGRRIAVHRSSAWNRAHEDAYVALRNAFAAARRKLAEYEQFLRRNVESHELQT